MDGGVALVLDELHVVAAHDVRGLHTGLQPRGLGAFLDIGRTLRRQDSLGTRYSAQTRLTATRPALITALAIDASDSLAERHLLAQAHLDVARWADVHADVTADALWHSRSPRSGRWCARTYLTR